MPDRNGNLYVEEAARELGVHPNTVRNMMNDGRLGYVQLPPGPGRANGNRRVPPDELEGLIKRRAYQ